MDSLPVSVDQDLVSVLYIPHLGFEAEKTDMSQFTATANGHSINLSVPQDTTEDILIQTTDSSLRTFEISAKQKTSGSLIIQGDLEVEVFTISALVSLGADLRIEGNLTVQSFNISEKVVIGGTFRVTENINIEGMRISKGASVTTQGWSSLGTWVTQCTVNGSINIAGSITAPFGFHFSNLDIKGKFETPRGNYQLITTGNSSGKPITYY